MRPEFKARESSIGLNNKYFLDGRDSNSYAGVARVYGVHDRAWPPRAIYGKVRSMMAAGLERKCDIHAYVREVEARCDESNFENSTLCS